MKTHQRHVLMCTGPRCTANGIESEALFKKLGQLIDAQGGLPVKRTRTHCFAVCKEGPILVVYPDGVWYHRIDESILKRIVNDHLAAGQPVESLIFHRTGLGDVNGATQE